jgi:hypothetical protein
MMQGFYPRNKGKNEEPPHHEQLLLQHIDFGKQQRCNIYIIISSAFCQALSRRESSA